jgi:hypothetical protein
VAFSIFFLKRRLSASVSQIPQGDQFLLLFRLQGILVSF